MAVGYWLVNHSRREVIGFLHIPASTQKELAGNPVAAAITTWYLLEHLADRVAFVSDTYDDWPFPSGNKADTRDYRDVTDEVVVALVEAGILRDEGRESSDDDPDVYLRLLRNVWMD